MKPSNPSSPVLVVLLLFLFWIVPGTFGRDLWKADEPYSFGLVHHIVNTGDLIVPTLAGEPFMEKPPLFYITAAAFVKALPGLEPHVAARMANAFFMLLTLIFAGLTAAEFEDSFAGALAAVIVMGCTGLQVTAHKLITDVGLLAGFSMAFYGFALSRRRFTTGAVFLGIGTGIGFLCKGLLAPGIIGILALVLPIFPGWRRKDYFFSLLIAFIVALPWLVIWPYALYRRSPFLFVEWFWYQNLGRFLGFSYVGRRLSPASYLMILPWFALPALPLAVRALWKKRFSWRALRPEVQFSLAAFLVMFSVLTLSSSIRDIYALPMLLPLSLLAAAGGRVLSGKARCRLNSAGLLFFGLVALVLWSGWASLITGFPEWASSTLLAERPGYAPSVDFFLVAAACVYTLAWAFAAVRFSRADSHPAMNWTAGMVLIWSLLMTIWLPWFDAGSGYRALFTSLRNAIPAQHTMIASTGIGESERALLQYYAGIVTSRTETAGNTSDADLLLIEGRTVAPDPSIWRLLWERSRTGSNRRKETYRLYQKIGETKRVHQP